jgi:hypothetical protein
MRFTGDRATGKLLGVQLFGHRNAEVAKRIDIAATAIFHGMTIDAVNDLDLSYTPPLGSPCRQSRSAPRSGPLTPTPGKRPHSKGHHHARPAIKVRPAPTPTGGRRLICLVRLIDWLTHSGQAYAAANYVPLPQR